MCIWYTSHNLIFFFEKTKDTPIFFYNIGIISLKFPLSSQPVLGDWKIEALFQVCLHLCVFKMSEGNLNSSNFKMWLIDSCQQLAIGDITVLQALFLLFNFVMSETKESFAPRTNARLVDVSISVNEVRVSIIALNVKAKGSHSATP